MAYTQYDWITDNLALGALVHEPEQLPFDAILSLAEYAPLCLGEWLRSGRIDYRWCPVVDDFCDGTHAEIVRQFEAAAALIDSWLQDDKRVLVHCGGGISRSATAVVWYFVRYRGYAWDEALATVKARRPSVNPDISFELPLRLANREPLTPDWIERHIVEYVATYRNLGRSDRGVGIDESFVRAALQRQGTLPLDQAVGQDDLSAVRL